MYCCSVTHQVHYSLSLEDILHHIKSNKSAFKVKIATGIIEYSSVQLNACNIFHWW